jgi:hypothetical protein
MVNTFPPDIKYLVLLVNESYLKRKCADLQGLNGHDYDPFVHQGSKLL